MTVNRVRGFLVCMPKPSRVVALVDGEPQEIELKNRSYQKIAETIVAMRAEQLQLFDEAGKLLRATRLDDADSKKADPSAHVLPAVLANDPQAAMFSVYATELAAAYRYATKVAFGKMVECFDRVNERSASIEQRLERAEALARRLRDEQAEDAIERAQEVAEAAGLGGNDAFLSTMASAFMSGQAQRPQQNGAAAKNGAAPKNGGGKGGAA